MDTDKNEYFASYEDLEVHKLMIEDGPRTQAYKEALFNNKAWLKDKVVMDVGCGTSILSIFCAQAGAKKVYAIEASGVANIAKEIVRENDFEDVIEVIHSKVEDVVLPDNLKVDAIVSEWMGFYLLHEGMLDSVFLARDKFLKVDGQMFPHEATIYIAPCSVPSLYKNWEDVYGISMSAFAKHLRTSKYNKPEILTIEPEDLMAEEIELCTLNLLKDTVSDLDHFSIKHVAASAKDGHYQGLCVWFDCTFPNLTGGADSNHVTLKTGPNSPSTHWKQAVIVLPEGQEMEEGEPIAFQMDLIRDHNNHRRYNLQVTMLDPDKTEHPQPCYCYKTVCILIRTYMNQNNITFDDDSGSDDNMMEDEAISDRIMEDDIISDKDSEG